jgi:hypothetical protein
VSNESGNAKYAPRPGNIPGVAMNLGGIDFVLAPLGLRLIRESQAKTKELQKKAAEGIDVDSEYYALNIDSVFESLRRNYPEITRDEVESLIDAGNLPDCVNAIMGASGLKKVTPGELKPGG